MIQVIFYFLALASVNGVLLKVSLNHLANELQQYLYGDPSINISGNKNFILSTINYLKETLRLLTF